MSIAKKFRKKEYFGKQSKYSNIVSDHKERNTTGIPQIERYKSYISGIFIFTSTEGTSLRVHLNKIKAHSKNVLAVQLVTNISKCSHKPRSVLLPIWQQSANGTKGKEVVHSQKGCATCALCTTESNSTVCGYSESVTQGKS